MVSLGKLQLVGATALFVAAKYEEINCPSVQEIVYMVDGAYTADEILKAERFMLSMLQFELGWPGPMSFLRRISKADDYDLETRTLAKYFLEITVMDERFVGCSPSFIAAGAHFLARSMLKKGEWVSAHVLFYCPLLTSHSRKRMFIIPDILYISCVSWYLPWWNAAKPPRSTTAPSTRSIRINATSEHQSSSRPRSPKAFSSLSRLGTALLVIAWPGSESRYDLLRGLKWLHIDA